MDWWWDIAVPGLMIAVLLTIAGYNVRHDGSPNWAYQWRSRKDATGQFWLNLLAYLGMAGFIAWWTVQANGWLLPVKP
jgi:hypothetical protein